MTADEMLQLDVNVVELDAKFADQINEVLILFASDAFGSGHVEELTRPDLKRLADDLFGRILNLREAENATTMAM
jgi:hypothetical protein